jgi:basic membrane protein A
VAVVAGVRTAQVDWNVRSFKRGIEAVLPRAKVLVEYANETIDRTRCEQIANSQIDRGADVVFAMAGKCGTGALAVARARGVWGAGDQDAASQPADRREDLLVRIAKEYEMAVDLAVVRFAQRSLPAGRDLVLRLNDDYAVDVSMSYRAPPAALSKTIERCSSIRRRAHAEAQ